MAQKPSGGWTLADLASILGGVLDGPADLIIHRPVPAGDPDPHGLTFAESQNYVDLVVASGVGAVIILSTDDPKGVPSIRHPRPRQAFGHFLALCAEPLPLNPGIHETAIVAPDALIDPTAQIGAYSVIEPGSVIEAGAKVYAFCYVGERSRIGKHAVLMPRVTLYQDVSIGDHSTINSGAVIGADGFGYYWDGSAHKKVPQVGGVKIGAHVEIGANTCIDRATAGATQIKAGVKLDNLVQVAHNCQIGSHTIIAALCGVSGSTIVGERVTMAGQVGTKDHVKIGNDIVLGGRTGVTNDLSEPGAYWGTPATPLRKAMHAAALSRKLPELLERIKTLEAKIQQLEQNAHD